MDGWMDGWMEMHLWLKIKGYSVENTTQIFKLPNTFIYYAFLQIRIHVLQVFKVIGAV